MKCQRNIAARLHGLSVVTIMTAASLAHAGDNVAGNMIQFNNDGCWTWYTDERAIIDPANDRLLISSVASSPSSGVRAGTVRVSTFDPKDGSRKTVEMSQIDEDDHNVGALMVLPDGKYLTMYANHGNTGLGDPYSRYRISARPHESSEWTPEAKFDWSKTAGWDTAPYAKNNACYHNLFYLSAEDRIYDFTRGTHQAMNILTFDYKTNTPTWSGQFEGSKIPGYGQGYFKFASNGFDKIYFIGTETHPRAYNTSIYAGYIQGGKSYAMSGKELDSNIFDSVHSATDATVPDIAAFTTVQKADEVGAGFNRLWTCELAFGQDGALAALFTGRVNDSMTDHRLFYARWDGKAWQTHEIAKMGENIYKTEEDYTGIGSVVPDDLDVVYISTPINPASGEATAKREIYKGVTADGGAKWTWTAVTASSTVDNFRPIVPKWSAGNTALAWMRGTYTTAQDIDTAVVGLVERKGEKVGPVYYVDATAENTKRGDGAEGLWKQRTGLGNGGTILEATRNEGHDAPALKSTVAGITPGTYDVFAYFWGDPTVDSQIQVGTDPANLMQVRVNGAQQAEAAQFDGGGTGISLSNAGSNLYRAYVGRVNVPSGGAISVFVDDAPGGTGKSSRTAYDGIGYAPVAAAAK